MTLHSPRSARAVRDEIAEVRAFEPDADLRILALQHELDRANAREREQRAARKRVRDGLATATHVRLADGWVEVIARTDDGHVIVANGVHDPNAIPVRKILDVRNYSDA